ncbi:MAG: LysR substrate-binding domain-containing protein [Rikenellaceae bacterium]
MTLQQLEYIIAVEKHGQFVKAAAGCNVTQSTLSAMIQKLEQELDIVIFDRTNQPIKPTPQGEIVLQRAKIITYNAAQLLESLQSERSREEGEIKIGIIPTVAPYIVPKLIKLVNERFPKINLSITEARTSVLVEKLECAELDTALMATPLDNKELLEVPIYYEEFLAYIAPKEALHSNTEIDSSQLANQNIWLLKEGHCLRNQVLDICKGESANGTIYEAGSIDTLVKIVDHNGGCTIIPKLHVDLLNPEQRLNVRPIATQKPNREVSLVVRSDYIRERIINIIADIIKDIVPQEMIDERLKRYSIRF